MTEDKGSSWAVPWPAVMTVLTLLGGISYFLSPLESSRPSGTANSSSMVSIGKQDVDARLWQDPFEPPKTAFANLQWEYGEALKANAPETHPVIKKWKSHEIGALRKQIEECYKHGNSVLILPVLMEGSRYPEAAETRLRARNAVLSALSTACIRPVDGEHLGYVALPWDREVDIHKPNGLPNSSCKDTDLVVPYEWFVNIGVHGDSASEPPAEARAKHLPASGTYPRSLLTWSHTHVLVLWVCEEALEDRPLLRLALLLQEVRKGGHDTWNSYPKAVPDVRIIGPRTSTIVKQIFSEIEALKESRPSLGDLRQILAADRGSKAETEPGVMIRRGVRQMLSEFGRISDARSSAYEALRNVKMYSPTSTTEDAILAHDTAYAGGMRDPFRELKELLGMHFERAIGNDRLLCIALAEELRRRQIDPTRDDIAVIGEWDTLYGRALPVSFAAVLKGMAQSPGAPGDPISPLLRDWKGYPENLHPLTYLRGIDGLLPGEHSLRHVDKREVRPPRQEQIANFEDAPDGQKQADYLRRMERQLKALNDALALKGRQLKAIGVLGSDVYDKLLVLQALRSSFPETVFFTTDLDARLLMSSNWRAAHNLVVASHFGLQLNPKLQRSISPFRDTYQTSTFCTTLYALDLLPPGVLPQNQTPRLYEIGRMGAVDLSVDTPLSRFVHMPRPSDFPWPAANWMKVIGLLVLMALMLFVWRAQHRSADVRDGWSELLYSPLPFVIVAFPTTLAIIWLMHCVDGPGGEPFSLFGGVSVWPTTAIRAFAIAMVFHFLLVAARSLMANAVDLQKSYLLCGIEGDPESDSAPSIRARFVSFVNQNPIFSAMLVLPLIAITVDGHHTITLASWILLIFVVVVGAAWLRYPSRVRPIRRSHATFRPPATFSQFVRRLRNRIARTLFPDWATTDRNELDAQHLWRKYRLLGNFSHRLWRSALVALVFLFMAYAMLALTGYPAVPSRGRLSIQIHNAVLQLSIFAFVFLLFFAVDAIRLCDRFIQRLSATKTIYPKELLKATARRWQLPQKEMEEWLDVDLIAQRTDAVNKVLQGPLIILFLLIVARNGYFDNWSWPTGLVILFAAGFLFAVVCLVLLNRSARLVKARAVDALTARIQSLANGDSKKSKRWQKVLADIQGEQRGAFASPLRHPLLHALLIPSGGLGLSVLLDYLAQNFR